ncbi:MAG: phosphate acyltransferase PlsX [Candidatus Cloacimonetes bacterium]|nr:phosphate acyltransferase PlsX [Candidatus Cloacimonadota bacterium]MBL7085716.1 phosphate acyltransferase PlsX [Candidatus Cloacimonadota bacterium]
MKIALDAFGTDRAPYPEVEGAVLAANEKCCSKIFIVGNQDVLNKELDKFYYPENSIQIVDAKQKIESSKKPITELKRKPDSSLMKAVALVKNHEADALVSAGSTGAVMASSLLKFGRIHGVKRPGLAISLPTISEPEIVLDVGANVDCNAENLVQFAEMGSIYSSYFLKKEKPKVALLNIGEESKKGNEVSIEAHRRLKELEAINFIGNIEGKDILKGIADVIICDGFIGNIMLKTVEGVALSLFEILKQEFHNDWIAKIGAVLSYPAYRHLKKKLDYSEYGGAFLMGVNEISIIAHGRSNAKAICNAMKFASFSKESKFLEHIKEYYANSKEMNSE